MRSRRTRTAVAVVVVALAVLIPTVLRAGSSSSQTKANQPVSASGLTTRKLLAVLDRPRRRSDRLPQPAGEDRGAFSDRTVGEADRLARGASPGPAGGAVYVWPRKDGACFSTGSVSSCATPGQIATRGAIVAFAGGQQHGASVMRVAGIARDGVRAIEITLADGTRTRARVRDNAFLVDLASMPVQLRWVMPDGTVHQAPPPAARAPTDPRPFWRPRSG